MARRPIILFVTPPYHAGVVESAGVWMPLGLVYLAGHARAAGADPIIYDAMSLGHGHHDIARTLATTKPDIVAVSSITATEPDAREVCGTAKRINPGIVTILGGVHPTFCWEELFRKDKNVDLGVIGEGEETIAAVVRSVSAGAGFGTIPGLAYRSGGAPARTACRPLVPSLDAFLPAWDLLDWPRYFYRPGPEGRFAIVSSSRGCRKECSFCSQQKFWARTWRGREPLSFVTELEMLRDRYGVRVAMLSDETPTVDPARWERVLDLLIERRVGVDLLMETRVDDICRDEAILHKYREAGITHLYAGVESGDQDTLDMFKKDTLAAQSKRAIDLINGAGIVSETSFVLGGPGETPASIAKAVELAKWYSPDMAFFLALTPWPYSDMYPSLAKHVATRDYRKYNLVEPIIKPDAMALDEMRRALISATGAFFMDKFNRLGELPPWKRDYLVKVLKLLIEHSYLGREMRAMAQGASMPPEIAATLAGRPAEVDGK
ncbi:MAG: cobalamin B12-binding domain-containing protein [Deltaproteobacteria bacterium]|nr:cobalamin B12-binding domain-containing protein [Deltaproteobacteria bacterium]